MKKLTPNGKETFSTSVQDLSGFPVTQEHIERIACRCHESNRIYCQSMSDNSQASWFDAPEWQKESARDGVLFMIRNNFPTPAESHQNWMNHKHHDGWVLGPVKDEVAKTHPCMVPYDNLPEDQRKKDHIFRNTVISELKRIVQEENDRLAKASSLSLQPQNNGPDENVDKDTVTGGAPKVTKALIEAKIKEVEYVTHGTLTWCVLHMENGFTITGKPSACVSPENYDAELGRKIAYENSFESTWQLEGYLLAQKLYEERLRRKAPVGQHPAAVAEDVEADELRDPTRQQAI